MKIKDLYIALILIIPVLYSCNEEQAVIISNNAGFAECQYDYTLLVDSVPTAKKSYERAILNHAAFAEYIDGGLADSLKQVGLRKIEFFLYSDAYDLKKAESDQKEGSSMIRITLVDSLGNDANRNRVWPATYTIQNLSYLQSHKKLQSLGLTANLLLSKDTATNSLKYKYQFSSELSRSVRIIDLGNNIFQILSYGLANTKIYNVYYVGTIQKLDNLITE